MLVGVDDETKKQGSIQVSLSILTKEKTMKTLRKSEVLRGGDKPYSFSVDLPEDSCFIVINVEDAGDKNGYDHADIVKATFSGDKKLVAPKPPNWEDPKVVSVNKLYPRAFFKTYLKKTPNFMGKSSNEKSLNGTWKFMWSDTPDNRPKDFYKDDFDVTAWNDIKVPMSWQMAGFGLPIYVNNIFPFNSTPPAIDQSFNPVGSYKREFTLPKRWDGKEVLISFKGVDSAFTLWINGKNVGYSEDSRTTAEFDITKFLKPGKNSVAVEVIRFSTGAWLEDQDMFRLSGIFRDVDLIARPSGERINDFYLKTPLDKEYKNSNLELDVEIANPAGGKVEVELVDAKGQSVCKMTKPVAGKNVSFSKLVKQPKLWSAETPNLYFLYIRHFAKNGKLVETVPWRFGFRSTEIKNKQLVVNGKPIVIAGANRHEHSPKTGHTVSKAELLKDLMELKKNNFNAIRTCHYPNSPELYAYCDEIGLYINDEANIESHGYEKIPNMPMFNKSHLSRIEGMVERDKNFTSVIAWSLGNESGSGGAHNLDYEWIKKNDYRPVGYQRHGSGKYTDYNANFYVNPGGVNWYTKSNQQKPMIQSEYAHAMGNSSGNMKEYWDIFWKDNLAQGGFVWDFVDQGLGLNVPDVAWVKYPFTKSLFAMYQGVQPNAKGLKGIFYIPPAVKLGLNSNWTLSLKLTVPGKSTDSRGYYHLFSKDGASGALFLAKNKLIFQTFRHDRNRIVFDLPEEFFNGKVHTLFAVKNGNTITVNLDGKLLGEEKLVKSHGRQFDSYIAFGSGLGTALVSKYSQKATPSILSAKLFNKPVEMDKLNDSKPVVYVDFQKKVKPFAFKKGEGEFFAYGGYFEARSGISTPSNFCMNGLLTSDREEHPGLKAFKYAQQPFAFSAVDLAAGKFQLKNRNFFKAYNSEYLIDWEVTEDGKIINKGSVADLNCKPQETVEFAVPYGNITFKDGKEYRVNLRVKETKETAWAKPGFTVAWEQFQLKYTPKKEVFTGGELAVEENAKQIVVTGDEFIATFDKVKGTLVGYKVLGTDYINGALVPDFWRAPTDNDKAALGNYAKEYNGVNSFVKVKSTLNKIAKNHCQIVFDGELEKVAAKTKLTFDVYGDAHIKVTFAVDPKKSKVTWLKVGMRVQVKSDFEKISWYGVGPEESYPDRNYEIISRYSRYVDAHAHYPRPQEYGNITGVRDASVTTEAGRGLYISASPEQPLNISLKRYTPKVISAVEYAYELPPTKDLYLNIDYKVNGAAGVNTWGATPLVEYRVKVEKQEYSFTLFAK
jgi:beta-galactosidase